MLSIDSSGVCAKSACVGLITRFLLTAYLNKIIQLSVCFIKHKVVKWENTCNSHAYVIR